MSPSHRTARVALTVLTMLAGCASAPAPEAERPPDLLIIAMDNVRWDRTGLAGYARDTTPNLDALAASPGAARFTRAYSAASFSLPSYGSLFTGRDALSHGAGLQEEGLPDRETTLAEILTAYGYQTAAFTGGAHLSKELGLGQGFARYETPPGDRMRGLGPQVDQAIDWLASSSNDAPFFLFLQGYDAHTPYGDDRFDPGYAGPAHQLPGLFAVDGLQRIAGGYYRPDHQGHGFPPLPDPEAPPGPPAVPLDARDLAHIGAHYDAGVAAADAALGRALQSLAPRLEDAIVVALSDHGEALGESGYFRHKREAGDHVFHVPLVIRLPDGAPPRSISEVVSLTDLTPTLLDLLGLPPPAAVEGRSLSTLLAGGEAPPGVVAASGRGWHWVRSSDWSLRVPWGASAQWALYRDGAGPEVGGAPERAPEIAHALIERIAAWPEDPKSTAGVSSPQLRSALQDAGYWEAGGAP